MKRTERWNLRRVPTRFGPETRFALPVMPAVPFRATSLDGFERLKERLLQAELADARAPELFAPLRRAANDAASLAWATPIPLLALPELFAEKAAAARRYVARQAAVLRRGHGKMGVAA